MWCIPPQQDAAFVCQMEQILEVYQRPFDSEYPVICMDEQHKQLIEELTTPIPSTAGCPTRVDCEYIRHGSCVIWMFVEPLGGWREVAVTTHRTSRDWATRVQAIVDLPRYATARRITLVCDNLNTHSLASLYQAFPAEEALRIAQRIELMHTPKHGSWLNIAESELSVLTRQCLNRRLPTIDRIREETHPWTEDRNATQIGVDWQFRTPDARIKLKRLYPKIET